jgi:hypothetical protein
MPVGETGTNRIELCAANGRFSNTNVTA